MHTELAVIEHRSGAAPAAIDRACRELGFFRIPRSVVDRDLADRAWDDAGAFFDLPAAVKAQVAFPEPGYPYGYAPPGYEALAASDGGGAPADPKESFSAGPDCLGPIPPARHPAEAWLRSPSLWPVRPAGLRASWSAYFRALSLVAAELLSAMAVALGLPPHHFAPLIDRHTGALRALNYPAMTGPPTTGALRAGAHTDYGTLTILRTDEVPGLEIQALDGSWVPVAPDEGTFVVNLGDSIARWTNDRWRSTRHRVTAADHRPRRSMAFFHMANWDATIECLPTCRSADQPPRYPPTMAGPWLIEKFRRTVA